MFMRTLPHTRSCFVCGEANPLGLNLRFATDGRIVQTRFRPRPEDVGFRGVVHGGIVATVLDEIMAWVCAAHAHRFSFCAELNVRFLNPMSPGMEVLVTGELVANRKNRIFETKAQAQSGDGLTLATATGKYLPLKATELAGKGDDLIGDASWLLSGETGSRTIC